MSQADFATLSYAVMANAALLSPPTRIPGASKRHIRWFSIENLRYHVQQELPLLVDVSSTFTTKADPVVYNCTVSSVASKKSWAVAYRYSELVDFRTKLDNEWTCHGTNCSGSCQALRDIVAAYFPKKRLAVMSSSHGAIASREQKFKTVLTHLLRSVLLPGSVMKCMHARDNLPSEVFKFLGVTEPGDRRSLLQIFVDNLQVAADDEEATHTGVADNQDPSEPTQCMICLSGDNQPPQRASESGATEGSEVGSPVAAAETTDLDYSQLALPCHHTFHRKCIFQWLLFEFHCPVCRTGIFPTAFTNNCRAKRTQKYVQWWLSDFEEAVSSSTSSDKDTLTSS